MTMAKQTESRQRPSQAALQLDEMMGFNAQAMQAFMDASSTALQGWQAMNSALMETARHRYQEGIAALQKLAKCQSPDEAYQMQCDLCRSAMEGYSEDCAKLFAMASRMATERWAEWAPGRLNGVVRQLPNETD
jgi:hypothetical protein